jgi:hypothetical protein
MEEKVDFHYTSITHKTIEYTTFLTTCVLAILLAARGSKPAGLWVGCIGTAATMAVNILSKRYGITFTVREKCLQISWRKKTTSLLWEDIRVKENTIGLKVIVDSKNLEFVILKQIQDYKTLRKMIKEKSVKYNFPFIPTKE